MREKIGYADPPCNLCGGDGWLWDSTDSGSGAQVYCDCEHGKRLREKDRFQCPHYAPPSPVGSAPGIPHYPPCPRGIICCTGSHEAHARGECDGGRATTGGGRR